VIVEGTSNDQARNGYVVEGLDCLKGEEYTTCWGMWTLHDCDC
jgi:hypothetical protein